MTLRTTHAIRLAIAAGVLLAPTARADVLVSGQAGVVFGGDSDDGQATYGGAITLAGDRPLGLEVEIARSPQAFGDPRFVGNLYFPDNKTESLMAHVLVGPRLGERGRLYASVGGGWLKTQANFSPSDGSFEYRDTDVGLSAGAGGIAFFPYPRLGIRGDVRYFHALGDDNPRERLDVDLGNIRFWRGTAGLVFAF